MSYCLRREFVRGNPRSPEKQFPARWNVAAVKFVLALALFASSIQTSFASTNIPPDAPQPIAQLKEAIRLRGPSAPTNSNAAPAYFEGDFDGVTVDRNKLHGWPGLESLPELESQEFAWDGSARFASCSIIPFGGERVLYAEVVDDDPTEDGQTRFQWSMFLRRKLEVIHLQYELYLSPDIAELNNYPGIIDWFTLFELWNQRAPDLSAQGRYDGSARWNLNLYKDAKGPIYWAWDSEYMQPAEKTFQDMYPLQINRSAEIPIGRWFTLDIYFNRNGRTVVKVDADTVFDFVGQNTYPGRPELYPA